MKQPLNPTKAGVRFTYTPPSQTPLVGPHWVVAIVYVHYIPCTCIIWKYIIIYLTSISIRIKVNIFLQKDKKWIMICSAECCFVKYRTLNEANRAINVFNGQYTFPGVSFLLCYEVKLIYPLRNCWSPLTQFVYISCLQSEFPLTVRYADGERERLGNCFAVSV